MGKAIVRRVFEENFVGHDFLKWNSQVADKTGHSIIQGVGRAMRINVKQFITDLGIDPAHGSGEQDQPSDDEAMVAASTDIGWNGEVGSRFNGRT